jgi:hypothetical protein
MAFVVGDIATLTNTFIVDDVATDPTSVSVLAVAPDGTEVTYTYAAGDITRSEVGVYSLDVTCPTPGRWAAVWTGTGAAADVTSVTWVVAPTHGVPPDLQAVKDYLGDTSETDATIAGALAAETAAQARRCTIPADFPADLAEALLRRVARNLAARAVPVATFTSFEGGGTSARVPTKDAEVARLEATFPRLPVG